MVLGMVQVPGTDMYVLCTSLFHFVGFSVLSRSPCPLPPTQNTHVLPIRTVLLIFDLCVSWTTLLVTDPTRRIVYDCLHLAIGPIFVTKSVYTRIISSLHTRRMYAVSVFACFRPTPQT